MNRRSISIMIIVVAFGCLILDIATATIIYVMDPAYFYVVETNIPFRDFLHYRTFDSAVTFLYSLIVQNLLLLITATFYLYIFVIQKGPGEPLGLLKTIGCVIAGLALLYAIAMNLYGVSANIGSIRYLLGM